MLCVEIKLFCSGNEHPISSLIRRTLVEVNTQFTPSSSRYSNDRQINAVAKPCENIFTKKDTAVVFQ